MFRKNIVGFARRIKYSIRFSYYSTGDLTIQNIENGRFKLYQYRLMLIYNNLMYSGTTV